MGIRRFGDANITDISTPGWIDAEDFQIERGEAEGAVRNVDVTVENIGNRLIQVRLSLEARQLPAGCSSPTNVFIFNLGPGGQRTIRFRKQIICNDQATLGTHAILLFASAEVIVGGPDPTPANNTRATARPIEVVD